MVSKAASRVSTRDACDVAGRPLVYWPMSQKKSEFLPSEDVCAHMSNDRYLVSLIKTGSDSLICSSKDDGIHKERKMYQKSQEKFKPATADGNHHSRCMTNLILKI